MLNLKRKETLSEELARAAETGDVEWLKATLAAGVDVDSSNMFGTTALMRASSRGDVRMVSVLLTYGADPNRARNDKFTALALAAFFGHQPVVKYLVEHGADPKSSTRFGTSPEMWANARTFRSVASYLGDKRKEPTPTTRIVVVADPSAKQHEHFDIRGSSLSFSLIRRVALCSLILFLVVAVAEVIYEHRQAPPATVSELPSLTTESIPAKTSIEQNVIEPPVQSVSAAANLNHAEDLGKRNSSPAKPHNRVAQNRGQDNEETSTSIAKEPEIKSEAAPQESTLPPVKVTVSRPAPSRPAVGTTQLISSPNNEKPRSKVIQWP